MGPLRMYAQHPVDTAAVLRLLLPLLGALGLAAVADGQVFRVAPSFGAGARPVALAAADLDGDGAIDLAVANGTSRDLSILIGDGHGGFVTRSGPRDLFGLTSVAAADFDHDGHADVAVGTLSAASIFLGDGAGGFGPAHACGRGGPMAVTDVDGDGRPDLVGAAGHQAWVARGDGAGACGPAVSYDAGLDASAIASADLDGDARPELLLADRGLHGVIVLPNLGDGRFGAAVTIPLGSGTYPGDLVAADLDRDGHTDVALAAPGTQEIVRLGGDGLGGLSVVERVTVGTLAAALAVADLDGDGWPDLLAADAGAHDVVVLRGGERWSPPAGGFAVGHGPCGLVVADLDGDAQPDVAVANRGGPADDGGVSVLRGDGAGGFPAAPPTRMVGRHPMALAAADLDRDGVPDLVSANQVSGTLSILRGTGGGFVAHGELAVAADARDVAVADFDRDGWPDLAATHFAGNGLSVLQGTGGGAFAAPTAFAAANGPVAVRTSDLDGDGIEDAAVAGWALDAVSVLLGDGRGGFRRIADAPVGHEPRAIDAADFDRDGHVDLAVANWGSATVSILLGDGRGGFSAGPTLQAGPQTSAVGAGDVDGDGFVDVVAANEALWAPAGSVSLWRGDGAGGFAPAVVQDVGRGSYAVVLADLDLDGRLDVATANAFDHTVSLLASSSGGRLVRKADLPVGYAPTAMVARDLDGDGRTDLAVTGTPAGRGRVLILRNETPAADLRLAVDDGSSQAWPGERVTYAITVTNRGPLAVSGLTLPWTPAPGLRALTHAVSAGAYDRATGAWTGLDLRVGGQVVLTLSGTLDPMATGTLVQGASVLGPPGIADPTPADNEARDVDQVVPAADLAVTVSATPDPVGYGDVLTYAARVRNRGPLGAAEPVLELELPTALTFVPWPASPEACTETQGHVSCALGALDSGGIATMEIRARANFELRASTRVRVHSPTFDPERRNDDTIVTTAILPHLGRELSHGFQARVKGDVRGDWFRLRQEPRASYEVVVDEAPLADLRLERVASDLHSALAQAPHRAGARRLRLRNQGAEAVDWEAIRVATDAARAPTYRISTFETTGAFPRFNNAGEARTVVLVQNVGVEHVQGTLWFWDAGGVLLAQRPFELPPRGVGTFDTRESVAGQAGSITVTHDAGYGELAGKAVMADPTTGVVSESPMVLRAR